MCIRDRYLSNFRSYQGIRFIGQAEFVGSNKGTSVGMNLWIPPTADKKETLKTAEQPKKKKSKLFKRAKKAAENKVVDRVKDRAAKNKKGAKSEKGKKDKVFFYVLDTQGDTIRSYSRKIKDKGLVRMNWNMRTDDIQMPSRRAPKPEADAPSGLAALPGTYKIVAKYGELKDSAMVEVKLDPRVDDITKQDIQDLKLAYETMNQQIEEATTSFDKLKKAKKRVAIVEQLTELLPQDTIKTEMKEMNKEMKKEIEELIIQYVDKDKLKGIQRNPNSLNALMWGVRRYLRSSYGKPTPNAQLAIDKAQTAITKTLESVDTFFTTDWADYKDKVKAMEYDLFDLE